MQKYVQTLKADLRLLSSQQKAEASQRYFPEGVKCLGVTAADIRGVTETFLNARVEMRPEEVLMLTEKMLEHAEFSEEVMVAFGLINKLVKRHYDETLLQRFEFWLENYCTNWALVDDLCIKTAYQYLLARPHLIEQTQHWSHSEIPWCRRASNVVWVKFVKRKIGRTTYYLDKKRLYENFETLKSDPDPYVQKSVGWLLKATSVVYPTDVVRYVQQNAHHLPRSTIRYALEKVDPTVRKRLYAEINGC
ncbi:hypothetical protein NBRC116583_26400 [Arenicella sp. 4NH20-0111]|uniref:DNA alkylation repair protein n=1 Tax=Arenicella sp. 4NH20-0111 TaxID=3127648 RepID=UPI0031027B2A